MARTHEPVALYLVRHAIAAERGSEWPDDDLRPLTGVGGARFTRAVAGLASLDITIDEVLTSPLVRARQTADLLASGVPNAPPVREVTVLAPGHAPTDVMQQVAASARGESLALVGHEPDLGELAAFLLRAKRPIPFKKGGICRIDVEELTSRGSGSLVWFATPKILRQLAE